MYSGGRDDVFKVIYREKKEGLEKEVAYNFQPSSPPSQTAKILAQTFLTWDPMVIPKVLSSQSTFTVKSTDPNVTFINTSITNSNLSSGQCYQVVNAVLILPSGMSPNAISLHTIVALNSTINSIVMADRAFNETMVLDSMLSSPNCKDGSTQYNAMMIKAAPPYKVTMAVASLNATLVKAWNETASNNTTSNSSSTMGQPLIKRAGGGPPPPPGSQPTPTSTQSGKVQSTSAGGQGNGGGGPPQSGSQTGTQPPPQSTGGGGGPPQTGTQTGTQPPPQVISGDAQNSGGNGTQNDINQQQQQQQQGPGNSGACTTFGQYKITYNITICSLSDPDIYKVLSTGTANDADYKADLLQSAGSMYQSLVYPDLSPNVVTPSPGIIQFLFSVLVFDLAGSGQKVTVSGIVAGTRIEIWVKSTLNKLSCDVGITISLHLSTSLYLSSRFCF